MTLVETSAQGCFSCGETGSTRLCSTKDFCYETCSNEFDYVRCSDCGHVYLRNRPDSSALPIIYPSNYLTYGYEEHLGSLINGLRNVVQSRKVTPLRRYAKAGDAILDIGCGGGDFLDLVRRFGDPSWRLYGIDFSQEAVERVRHRGLNAVQARFEEVDWTEGPVGAIVMNQLIEHVADPAASIAKAFRMLRPGGVLIMETPNLDAWDSRLFRRRYWGGWHAPRHWNLFTPTSLGLSVERQGFEVAEVAYILSPFSWLHSIQYLLRERYALERIGRWFDVNRLVPLFVASGVDALQLALTGKTANMRLIARKQVRQSKPNPASAPRRDRRAAG